VQIVCPSCGAKNRVPADRLGYQPVCGRCAAALAEAAPVALDDDRLPGYIADNEAPVLVDFWAPWCGPCRTMAQQFAAAARELPQVRFAKVDTDASPRSAVQHRIRSIPTLALFRGGREVARVSGALPAPQLLAWVRQQLR
jgi:thioredoxin 2